MFTLWTHPEARQHVPDADLLERLRTAFPFDDAVVRIWPRRLVAKVLGRDTDLYAFRGYTRGAITDVFVDDTETSESLAWLIAHELCHHSVRRTPRLARRLQVRQPDHLHPAGDRFHELDPEELHCDEVATHLLGERLDRSWWRDRVQALGS